MFVTGLGERDFIKGTARHTISSISLSGATRGFKKLPIIALSQGGRNGDIAALSAGLQSRLCSTIGVEERRPLGAELVHF
jgi:hypothetical protein